MNGKGVFDRYQYYYWIFRQKKLPQPGMEMMNAIIDAKPNISIITKIEVLRFNTTERVYKILVNFINTSNIFTLDDLVVEKTISLCKAHRIKIPDAIIAATSLIFNFTLITRNTSDFRNVAELELLNPWENQVS